MSKDITKMSDADLATSLVEKHEDIRKSRFAMAGSKAKDAMKPRMLRRDIARIMTEQRRREIVNANQN